MKKRKALNIIHICIALLGLAIIVCYFVPSIEFINEKMLLVGIAFASEAVGYLIFVMGSAKSQKKIELLEQRVSLTNSLAYRIKNAGEKCFTEIPIGIIVYANDLKVEWANTKAKQIFNSSLVDRKLNNLYSGNYDNKDFGNLLELFVKKHTLDIGITLNKEIHKQFHKLYGKTNNTKEQFEEFKSNYLNNN